MKLGCKVEAVDINNDCSGINLAKIEHPKHIHKHILCH